MGSAVLVLHLDPIVSHRDFVRSVIDSNESNGRETRHFFVNQRVRVQNVPKT